MSAVFVCFAEADHDLAERLASALERAGVAIWRANGALIAAESAGGYAGFGAESDDMAALLAIWTPAARRGPWVRDLTRSALGFGKLVNVTADIAAPPFPYDRTQSYALEAWLAGGDLEPLERDLRARLSAAEASVASAASDEASSPGYGAPPSHAAAAMPEVPADGGDLLSSLQQKRLAAAVAGAAPFGRSAAAPAIEASPATPPPERRPAPPEPSRPSPVAAEPGLSAAAYEPMPAAPPSYSAPAPRRSGRGALWAGSAVAVVGLVVGAGVLTLGSHPPLTTVAARAPIDNSATSAPDLAAENTLAHAAVGRWATKVGGCDRPVEISVSGGQLTLHMPDGTTETGVIMADTADTFAVETSAGAVTYTIAGDVMTRSGAADGAVTFSRCARPARNAADDPANNAAAAPLKVGAQAAAVAMAMAGAGAATPPQRPTPIADEVDVSAFSPGELRTGEAALVQIYLHPVDQAGVAETRARAADPQTGARGQTTLDLELPRGTRVDVILDGGGLAVDETVRSVVWRGRPCACQFNVSLPAEQAPGARTLTARVMVGGVPVGRLSFRLKVVAAGEPADNAYGLRDNAAKHYERAFLSYSRHDRPEVLKSAQALHAAGIGYFQDILSIEPGQAWRERLFAEIDRCDLFLLFWSSHSAASDWVRDEVEYALQRRRNSSGAAPDITPVIIEGPPIPPPPASLASLHFNDMLRYVVVASELEAQAGRAAPD